jgi:hypothetical protein
MNATAARSRAAGNRVTNWRVSGWATIDFTDGGRSLSARALAASLAILNGRVDAYVAEWEPRSCSEVCDQPRKLFFGQRRGFDSEGRNPARCGEVRWPGAGAVRDARETVARGQEPS